MTPYIMLKHELKSRKIQYQPAEKTYYNIYSFQVWLHYRGNSDHDAEILEYLNQFSKDQMKKQIGSMKKLIYFSDAAIVLEFVKKFHKQVLFVIGPVSESHENVVKKNKRNTAIRTQLFFNKFRYRLQFRKTPEFCSDCYPAMNRKLQSIDKNTWQTRNWNNEHRAWMQAIPPTTDLYLKNEEDYVLLKIIGSGYIKDSTEVHLVSESGDQ